MVEEPGAALAALLGGGDALGVRACASPRPSLVGWLEGLFHGIQTAIYAQQMAARAQFEQIRRALPQGMPMGAPGVPGQPQPGPPTEQADEPRSGGMYL
ncbi:proteasome activator [Nocardioides convexus]|uniref:proteasome activator n=1 Tax=Nocardioides convexus TaxID=2712224 RepID=UPI003100EA5C